MKKLLITSSLLLTVALSTGLSHAGGEGKIYGSELMSKQERLEYRQKVLNAKSAEERAQIREQHHALMQERAKEQGKTLSDKPPAERGMMQQGEGMGMGGR